MNYSWTVQQHLNFIHDRFYFNPQNLTQAQRNNPGPYVDHSCNICYPNQQHRTRFTTFWNWFINNTSAYQSCQKSIEGFYHFLQANTDQEQICALVYLLYTIRFHRREHANTLIPLIKNCTNFT